MLTILSSGARIKHPPQQASMALSKATALKPDQLLVDSQVHLTLISHNTVECLRKLDLNQLDPWLISSPQASSLVNKDTVVLQLSLQHNTATNPWDMVALPVLEDMVVVLNQHQPRSGVLPLRKVTETALVVTKANFLHGRTHL